MAQILLYIDGADGFGVWTKVGTTPFLNAQDQPTNYIYSVGRNSNSDLFTFENTVLSGTINSVTLYVYAYSVTSGDFASILNGIDTGLVPPINWGWVSIDVSDILTSWELINAATILFDRPNTKNEAGVDCAYLLVNYTEAGEEKFGTATISGNGNISVNGQKKISITITISDNGLINILGIKKISEIILISGNGNISVIGSVGIEEKEGIVQVSGNGSIDVIYLKQARAPPIITSNNGIIEIIGTKKTFLNIAISDNGLISIDFKTTKFGITQISGSGNIEVITEAEIETKVKVVISGNGNISVKGYKNISYQTILTGNGSIINLINTNRFKEVAISDNGEIQILYKFIFIKEILNKDSIITNNLNLISNIIEIKELNLEINNFINKESKITKIISEESKI